MANPTGKNQYTGRASGHAELHKTIKAGTKGVNQKMTVDAYRPEDPGVVPNSNRSCQHAEV